MAGLGFVLTNHFSGNYAWQKWFFIIFAGWTRTEPSVGVTRPGVTCPHTVLVFRILSSNIFSEDERHIGVGNGNGGK